MRCRLTSCQISPDIGPYLTIGLILCQQQNEVIAVYVLRGVDKPIGVSTFELTRALPSELASKLPSIEQIERELGRQG